MARHGADLDERPSGLDRLESMGLRREAAGWVPEVDDVPPPVTSGESPRREPRAAVPTVGELAKAWATDRLPPPAHGLIDRISIASLVTVALAVLAIVVAGVTLLHHHASSGYPTSYDASTTGSSSYPADPTASSAPTAASDPTSIVVDVGGRVRKPGLVTLPAGARVADAIAAAGGPLRHKEVATLDLAARVADGQLLLVGVPATSAGGAMASGTDGSATGAGTAPVSLSTATIDELETLPGVGPVTAQKIIDWRTAHNGFTSVEELQENSGTGPPHYAAISPLVTP